MLLVSEWISAAAFVLFGLLLGSFANVVIWRVPRKESVVSPGSHCPSCDAPIAWYDNIPVVSWLVLRGRCRACGVAISPRYPLVEAASGALFGVAALRFGLTWQAVLAAVVFWLLLVLSMIDIDHYRLPNPLVALLAGLGCVAVVLAQVIEIPFAPLTAEPGTWLAEMPVLAGLLGLIVGGGVPAAIAWAYGAIRGKQGLGMGDIKLLAALGILLGPYVVMTLFLGSVIGMVAGLSASRSTRLADRRIPFGPSLSAGAILTVLAGPELWMAYLRLAGLA